LAEAEALADRVGILDRGRLLCMEPADELKARYRAETLEEAFSAATGREFEQEQEDEDAERGVFSCGVACGAELRTRGLCPCVRLDRTVNTYESQGADMRGAAVTLRHELIGLSGVLERN